MIHRSPQLRYTVSIGGWYDDNLRWWVCVKELNMLARYYGQSEPDKKRPLWLLWSYKPFDGAVLVCCESSHKPCYDTGYYWFHEVKARVEITRKLEEWTPQDAGFYIGITQKGEETS